MQEPSPFPDPVQAPARVRDPGVDTAGSTLTFLFSDIEGSTRLEQTIGTNAYGGLRERHRVLMRGAFQACGGEEQGTEGDSFFVVFRSRAVGRGGGPRRSAVAGRGAVAGGSPIRVRMGLHSGEAATHGGSLVGIDINRAARIAAAAHGGQVLVSDVTRSLVRDEALEGIAFRDLGSHRLKDLDARNGSTSWWPTGCGASSRRCGRVGARPRQPAGTAHLVRGREAERAAVASLLGSHRLVTMTGPGGTGKTRLSIAVAVGRSRTSPTASTSCRSTRCATRGWWRRRSRRALGLAEAGSRPTRDLIVDWLAPKTVLVILDNFEQVVEAAPLVGGPAPLDPRAEADRHLAGGAADLRRARVPGARPAGAAGPLGAVGARAGPAADARGGRAPRSSATYESVRLFVDRATAVRPDFKVTNENAPAVAAICARLRGMPLAIELAAARVKVLSPDAILARLTHQLAALGGGSRDLPERQQTLRGAIAWSYDILDAGDRRLLERLSVFRAGIDLEAAEAVCGPAEEIDRDVLDGLGELADQSLLRVIDGDRGALPDAGEHPGLRRGPAGLAGRGGLVRGRFGAWFMGLAERARPLLAGPDQRRWLDLLELEHDNLRAALDRAVAGEDAETWRSDSRSRCGVSGRCGATCSRRVADSTPSRRAVVAPVAGPPGAADGGARRGLLVAGGRPLHASRLRGGGHAVARRREPGRAGERALQLLVRLHGADQRAGWFGQHGSRWHRLGVAPGGAGPVPDRGRRARSGQRPVGDGQQEVLPERPGRGASTRWPRPSRSSGASAIGRWRPGRST